MLKMRFVLMFLCGILSFASELDGAVVDCTVAVLNFFLLDYVFD